MTHNQEAFRVLTKIRQIAQLEADGELEIKKIRRARTGCDDSFAQLMCEIRRRAMHGTVRPRPCFSISLPPGTLSIALLDGTGKLPESGN